MFVIMVAEDDPHTQQLMCRVLSRAGFEVLPVTNGREALDVLDHRHADLILLDAMMPEMDGYTLLRTLRGGGSDIPVLMVTARSAPPDKRLGFLSGCDDYMTKPVDEEEMILRIHALLRRARIAREKQLTVGGTVLDYHALSVTAGGECRTLPQKEFRLLFLLLSYPNRIFTRRELMDEIWDMDSETDERTVDVHINRLRDRYRDNPDFEILTIRGIGYKAVYR